MKHPEHDKGCIEGDCQDGFGVYIYFDQKKYEGYWKNGKRHGKGKEYIKLDLLVYDGEWFNDECHGKGIVYYFDKIEYEGEWKDGYQSGFGTLYHLGSKNKKYVGEFFKKEFHGQGTLYYENGQVAYEGEWKNGEFNGQGTQYLENGQVKYEGEFKKDGFHGKGNLYWENGNICYKGQLKKGEPHKKGIFYHENGLIFYDGQWKDGKKYGKGQYFYDNGTLQYIGQVADNQFHGIGGSYYKNDEGAIYDSNGPQRYKDVRYHKDDLKDYHNDLYYRGNAEYIGEWKNGKPHGKGVSYYEDNQIKYIGEWSEGKRHGKGTEYSTNRDPYKAGCFSTQEPISPDHWALVQQVKYIGQWLNDLRHGKGTEYFKRDRDDWDFIVFPQMNCNFSLPVQERAEKYQQIKYKGQWENNKRADGQLELKKQSKLLELIDKYEQYRDKIFSDTFEVKDASHELFRNLEVCNTPMLKAYIKRALPEKLADPQLMINALNDLKGEILYNNEEKNKCVHIGYNFITTSDNLLKAYEFMVEGRLIEEFEEKYSYLSDQELDREMAQIDFIVGYLNFIRSNEKS